MRRILHLWMALAMICLSAGPVSLAWAQPGTGNDVGQGNGHGQGMLTAPGQTGVQTNQSQTQVQPTGNGSNNSNGNGTGASNAHGNNPNASDNAAQAQGNGKSNATPPGGNGKGNTTSSAGNDNGVTGNSGTIKISPSPLSSSSMANHPHPGCTFFILGFDFPTQSGTYWITPQPTNGNGPAGSTTSRTTPIAYANGATSPYAVLVQSTERPNGKGSDIQIGPITDFASGQYKVHVNSDATPGGAKQKVFRLDCPSQSNTVTAEVPSILGAPTESAQVTTPLQASVSEVPTTSTQTNTPSTSGTSTATTNQTTANRPEIQGVAQTPVAVAGVQAGQQVTVPAGVPVEQSGETVTVTGPAVVMVGSQPTEIAPGEELVLGVQAEQIAPNTGVAGLVATDFVYRVQAGDTLQAIAAAYYGDAAYAWSLYNANSDVLGGASTLTPGTLLALP